MTRSLTAHGAVSALGLAALLAFVPACDDAEDNAAKSMAQLVDEVKQAQQLNKQMATRMDRLERKFDGFRQDIDRLGREKLVEALDIQNAAGEAAPDGEAAMAEAAAMGGGDLAAALDTEDGRAAVEKAMQAIQQKRDGDRRERMVSGMIDRFAEQANLSPAQTEDMSRILGDSFKQIGDVWSNMRGGGDMSADERATLREDNMARMEEIRVASDDKVKAVLNVDQYSIYEEQAQRLRGWGGRSGRSRRGGDGGGGGARR